MFQVISPANYATMEGILKFLPEPSSIKAFVTSVEGVLTRQADHPTLAYKVSSRIEAAIEEPTKEKLLKLISLPYPRDLTFKEANFYITTKQKKNDAFENHLNVNITLTDWKLNIEYWGDDDTNEVSTLLSNVGKFNDIEVVVTKHKKN